MAGSRETAYAPSPTATVRLSASVNFASTGSIYLLAVPVIPAVA
jgi:hypothetical protein